MSRIASFLIGLKARSSAASFERATHDPTAAQEALLRRMMAKNRDTEYGREHGFGEVRGFADATGGDAVNQRISQQRSDNVARQLMLLGIRKHQIVTAGFASEIPAASNETAKGRKSNRRVEVTVR